MAGFELLNIMMEQAWCLHGPSARLPQLLLGERGAVMRVVPALKQGPSRPNQALLDVQRVFEALLTKRGDIAVGVAIERDRTSGHLMVDLGWRKVNLSLALQFANFEYFSVTSQSLLDSCKRFLQQSPSTRAVLQPHLLKAMRPLSDIELRAVRQYTLDSGELNFTHINAILRDKGASTTKPHKTWVRELITALLVISACNKNIVANRRHSEKFVSRIEKRSLLPKLMAHHHKRGEVVRRRGLISATESSKAIVYGDSHVMFASGNQGSIASVSRYPAEKEVLYPPALTQVIGEQGGKQIERFIYGYASHDYDWYNISAALTAAHDYLKRPYKDRMDVRYGIARHNHALAHHVRTVSLAEHSRLYLAAFMTDDKARDVLNRLSDRQHQAIEIILAFSKTGRESELAFWDDKKRYQQYQEASVGYMRRYMIGVLGWPAAEVAQYEDVLRHMGNPNFDEKISGSIEQRCIKSALHHVVDLAHKLDLARCYTAEKYDEALRGYMGGKGRVVAASEQQRQAFELLQKSAFELLHVTGDAQQFSRFGVPSHGYDSKTFVKMNRYVDECVSACMRHLLTRQEQMLRLCSQEQTVLPVSGVMAGAGRSVDRKVMLRPPIATSHPKTKFATAAAVAPVVKTPLKSSVPSKHVKQALFAPVITPLIDAIKAGRSAEVYALARDKKHCQERDAQRMTPLMWAVKKGSIGYIKACLDGGASVHDRDGAGNTPKTLAQTCGSFAVVKMFKSGNLMAKGYVC